MIKIDHQLAILEAHRNGHRIQVRNTPPNHDDIIPNGWRDLAKSDQWFNFIKFEYRLAPVDAEVWGIYDHQAGRYLGDLFPSADIACAAALGLCDRTKQPTRYAVVRLAPKQGTT